MGNRGIRRVKLETPEQQAFAVFEGMRLYFDGFYEQAISQLSGFLESNPDHAVAQKYLASATEALRVGHVPESRVPADAREAHARAYALYMADLLDEARTCYEVARKLASDSGINRWLDLEEDIEGL